jgi:hypothetical protein
MRDWPWAWSESVDGFEEWVGSEGSEMEEWERCGSEGSRLK